MPSPHEHAYAILRQPLRSGREGLHLQVATRRAFIRSQNLEIASLLERIQDAYERVELETLKSDTYWESVCRHQDLVKKLEE